MWTVSSQKNHNERLGEQEGLAYIHAKAQLGVVRRGGGYGAVQSV